MYLRACVIYHPFYPCTEGPSGNPKLANTDLAVAKNQFLSLLAVADTSSNQAKDALDDSD